MIIFKEGRRALIRKQHKTITLALYAALTVSAASLHAEDVIVPFENVEWTMTGNPALQVMVLAGDPRGEGPYSMLIKAAPGTEIPPHSHPDAWRHSTVVSGSIAFGVGSEWDEAALVVLSPGSFWTEAPDVPHFIRIGDEEAVVLLTAFGPTGMSMAESAE